MSEKRPSLSVIIPVYNAAPYLRSCLDSVLTQNLSELEVICINDCSTDESLSILREYACRDSRVAVLDNESRLRAGGCRNRGIEVASGEYIHFLDADDYLCENVYTVLYQTAKRHRLDILRAGAYDLDARTGAVSETNYNALKNVPEKWLNKPLRFLDEPALFTRVCVAPWGGLIRREFLTGQGIRFNDLMCVNDRSFFAQTVFRAGRILFTDVRLLYYRVNNSGSLIGNRGRYFSCHFASYGQIFEAARPLPEPVRRLYLENELNDILFWMKKYAESEFRTEIAGEAERFLAAMDRAPWDGRIEECYWYGQLEALIGYCRRGERAVTVSVIMPVYNAAGSLVQSLESLRRQRLEGMEILCVDDGSTDGTLGILWDYALRDSRIRVFSQPNSFAGVARNRAMEMARGEYIAFLDGDDRMVDGALETMYRRCRADDSDVLISAAEWFSEDPGRRSPATWILDKRYLPEGDTVAAGELCDTRFQLVSANPWAKLFRAQFLRENGIRFPALARSEDVLFMYLSMALAGKISILREVTVLQRRLPGVGLEEKMDIYPLTAFQARMLLKEELEKRGLYETFHQSYANNFVGSLEYHLKKLKTGATYVMLVDEFIHRVLPMLELERFEENYLYEAAHRQLVAEIRAAGSGTEYLFFCYRKGHRIYRPTEKRGHAGLVRRGVRCLRENGAAYTAKRMEEKLLQQWEKTGQSELVRLMRPVGERMKAAAVQRSLRSLNRLLPPKKP